MLEIDPRRLPPKFNVTEKAKEFQRKGVLPEYVHAPLAVVICDGKISIDMIEDDGLAPVREWTRSRLLSLTPEWLKKYGDEHGVPYEHLLPVVERHRAIASPEFADGLYMFFDMAGSDITSPLSHVLIAPLSPPIVLKGFPGFWELFGFLLDGRTREKYFEPAFHDLMADYLQTRSSEYQSLIPRVWLNICFTIRTIRLVIQSLRAAIGGAAIAVLISQTPPAFRQRVWEWWQTLFR